MKVQLIILLILFIFSTCQTIKNPVVFPDSSSAAPKHTYPDNPFDLGGWVSYGVFLILMLIIPIVFCIVCCCTMGWIYFLRCCGLCGSRYIKKGDDFYGYKKGERLVLLIPYIIIYLAILLSSIFAIVWTISFVESVRTMTKGTENGITEGFNYPSKVQGSLNDLIDQSSNISSKAQDSISGITGINTVVSQAINRLNVIPPNFDSIQKQLNDIQNNLTSIKNINNEILKENGLTNVPSIQEVPDISSTQLALNDAKSSVNSLISSSNEIQKATSSGVSTAQNTVNQFTQTAVTSIKEVKKSSNDVFDTMNSTINSLGLDQNKRNEFFYYIYLTETLYNVIFCILYAIPPCILIYGILYILIGKSPLQFCFSCGAFYIYLFMGIYMLLFGIQFIIIIVLGHACERSPALVSRIDNYITPIQSPIGNISISKSIDKLLNCKNSTSILDVIGFNLNSLNITQRIDESIALAQNSLNLFDINTLLGNSTNQITNLNLNLGNVDTDYSKNITSYKNQVLDVRNQTQDLSKFGFNQTYYLLTYSELNNRSKNIGGAYWADNNITNLNSSSIPYVIDSNYFQVRKDIILTLIDIRVNATIRSNNVYNNITTILKRLNDIEYSLNQSLIYKNQISNVPNLISTDLNQITIITNNIKLNISSLLDSVSTFAKSGVNQFTKLLSCDSIGNFYKDQVQTNLCQNCLSFIILGSIASICLGLSMCFLYPVLLEGTKRVGHEFKNILKNNDQNIEKIPPHGPPSYHYELENTQQHGPTPISSETSQDTRIGEI